MRAAARRTAEEWPVSRGVGIVQSLLERAGHSG